MLADGFYEWQRIGAGKRPMRIVMGSGRPFAFAGLWETWREPGGNAIPSCAIITTTANDMLKAIHDRMPVILPRKLESFWLGGLEAYEVSTLVNSFANRGPDVIDPVRRKGTDQATFGE